MTSSTEAASKIYLKLSKEGRCRTAGRPTAACSFGIVANGSARIRSAHACSTSTWAQLEYFIYICTKYNRTVPNDSSTLITAVPTTVSSDVVK